MAFARIINGVAVDVRPLSPDGCFTQNIVDEFVEVADDVQDGWVLVDGILTAPVPHIPTPEEIAAQEAADAAKAKALQIAALKAQIAAIEAGAPITPRLLRELTLIVRGVIQVVDPDQPPVYGLEVANTLNNNIVAIRAQIQALESAP